MELWRQCHHARKHKKTRFSRVQPPPKDTTLKDATAPPDSTDKHKTKSRRRKSPTPKRALLDDINTHSTMPVHYTADDAEERYIDSNTTVFEQPPPKRQKSRFLLKESTPGNHSTLSKNFKPTSSITVADQSLPSNVSKMELGGKTPLPDGDGMGAARRHSDVRTGAPEDTKDAWQIKNVTAVVGVPSRGLESERRS
jgi:hypothetical protein